MVLHCAADKRPVSEVNKQVQTKDKVAIVTHLQRHTYPQVINEKKRLLLMVAMQLTGNRLDAKGMYKLKCKILTSLRIDDQDLLPRR